jgi:uncharacterized protein
VTVVVADLAWAALECAGLEHVMTRADESGFRADGQLVMVQDGPFRVRYLLECDAGWRFTTLTITVTDSGRERTLQLAVAADGRWQADGKPRPDLDGCIDIDINCTPLTNTLPIRRLRWASGASHDLSVAFVSVPDLAVRAVSQRYTQLEPRLYRYQSGAFRADLPVDGDGFVLDYPGCWTRVGPQPAG